MGTSSLWLNGFYQVNKKQGEFYQPNWFREVDPVLPMRKAGAVLKYVGRASWITLPWFNDELMTKPPENEGWEYWNALPWFKDGLMTKFPENEGWEYWNEIVGWVTTNPG
jgi:hypothetical protein